MVAVCVLVATTNYYEGGEDKPHRLKLFIGDAVHILKQNAGKIT